MTTQAHRHLPEPRSFNLRPFHEVPRGDPRVLRACASGGAILWSSLWCLLFCLRFNTSVLAGALCAHGWTRRPHHGHGYVFWNRRMCTGAAFCLLLSFVLFFLSFLPFFFCRRSQLPSRRGRLVYAPAVISSTRWPSRMSASYSLSLVMSAACSFTTLTKSFCAVHAWPHVPALRLRVPSRFFRRPAVHGLLNSCWRSARGTSVP
ncbi:hypothetical protein PLICRDRAFT_340966 [Plicaturopsis crispa FD-325 SS-3]|uniref:Uncharacterized protein n=1 Tax=Plicaturopsis crispa FD-325 SS-3 TaxID=944288 RepID=A0A0C9SL28_PLICR|nr:hypothetical protein PLICRDRAFT_340966 [Plicaturopsis crispa FD-325 SS-3]